MDVLLQLWFSRAAAYLMRAPGSLFAGRASSAKRGESANQAIAWWEVTTPPTPRLAQAPTPRLAQAPTPHRIWVPARSAPQALAAKPARTRPAPPPAQAAVATATSPAIQAPLFVSPAARAAVPAPSIAGAPIDAIRFVIPDSAPSTVLILSSASEPYVSVAPCACSIARPPMTARLSNAKVASLAAAWGYSLATEPVPKYSAP